MTMSDFHPTGGIMVPSTIVATDATSDRPQGLRDYWRTDTLAVSEIRVQDEGNTAERYKLMPDADARALIPSTPNGGFQGGQNFEVFLGAEALDQSSLIHLNGDFGSRAGAHGSPSIAACRDASGFRAAHERFLALAKGEISTRC